MEQVEMGILLIKPLDTYSIISFCFLLMSRQFSRKIKSTVFLAQGVSAFREIALKVFPPFLLSPIPSNTPGSLPMESTLQVQLN